MTSTQILVNRFFASSGLDDGATVALSDKSSSFDEAIALLTAQKEFSSRRGNFSRFGACCSFWLPSSSSRFFLCSGSTRKSENFYSKLCVNPDLD